MDVLYEDPGIREIGHDRTVAQGPIGAGDSRTRDSPHGSSNDDRGVCRDGPEDRQGLKKPSPVDPHESPGRGRKFSSINSRKETGPMPQESAEAISLEKRILAVVYG